MKITEPVTMLTDYFLAGFSLVLSLKLLRLAHTQGRLPVSLWGWVFLPWPRQLHWVVLFTGLR